MNKDNIFRSSSFYMAEGDVLHLVFLDEENESITFNLVSGGANENILSVPDAPTALAASDITSSSFTANWNFQENTEGFYLDVAEDEAFTSFVAGYEDLDVGLVNEYSVIGLIDAYTYYYRLRAYNDNGISDNSNTILLTTACNPVLDGDGNNYTYVTIGTQQWLVENLKTTKYIDGTAIPNLPLDADWYAEDGTPGHDGAYCWYDNDIGYKNIYGALYNWYAVDNAHGLAPIGWRVPSDIDLLALINFLGDEYISGGYMKEDGLSHWASPNVGADNSSGLTILPAGSRIYFNPGGAPYFHFDQITQYSQHWGTTVDVPDLFAGSLTLAYDTSEATNYYDYMRNGLSVRCVRDI